ncbi:MAG: DUF389 domain-containing protein [Actinomycetales bacterium]
MMQLRVVCAAADSPKVVEVLDAEPGVAHLTRVPDVSRHPRGDVIEAILAREIAQDVIHRLVRLGITKRGQISLQTVDLVLSDKVTAAQRELPEDSGDSIIWDELLATTGDESRLTPTFLAFLVIGCLLAATGVVTDSAVTIVGAMVVSPDFGPLAGLAVAAVSRRRDLAAQAALALGAGYPIAIAVTALFALVARSLGALDPQTLSHASDVAFVYQVGPYSFVVAVLAGIGGMLALTSQKSGVLVGVFISVTTIPAAGFVAVSAVLGRWDLCGQAFLQLLVNMLGVVLAGMATLWLRRQHVTDQRFHDPHRSHPAALVPARPATPHTGPGKGTSGRGIGRRGIRKGNRQGK